ncbi:hypothetical protein G3I76_40350, partial [Streptomyces sp. SID11233]|nr:hypothetical protein [Streptomyces sp. SID11233]
MGPEDYGQDPLGEFLARFFGGGGPSQGRRQPRYYDFARLMSEPTRQLVQQAANYAAQNGSSDLGTEHLLRAAVAAEPTRELLAQA